jgi:hypothetical protein
MRNLTQSIAVLIVALGLSGAPAGEKKPAAEPERAAAFATLAQFVGGTWSNDNPKFLVEFKYQWALNKTVIRGTGNIDKGGKYDAHVESNFGWDPAKKKVYYLDFHGGEQVFYGNVRAKGNELHYEFEAIVGQTAKWRSDGKFTNPDTYEFEIFGEKDGKWVPVVKQTLKRHRE